MQLIQEEATIIKIISGLKGMLVCYAANLETIQNLFLCDLDMTGHETEYVHFLDMKRYLHLFQGY